MKARRKKSSAGGTAAKKTAVSRKQAAHAAGKRSGGVATRQAASGAATKRAAVSASRRSTIALAADCTIEHSPGLHKQLAKILTDRACVTLDFTAVKRSDTAGLQVLAAFIRERRDAGRAIELAGMQDNFLATTKLLGLGALFSPVMDDGSTAQAGHA
jgi:ABC-type transporter Mla MlaB component